MEKLTHQRITEAPRLDEEAAMSVFAIGLFVSETRLGIILNVGKRFGRISYGDHKTSIDPKEYQQFLELLKQARVQQINRTRKLVEQEIQMRNHRQNASPELAAILNPLNQLIRSLILLYRLKLPSFSAFLEDAYDGRSKALAILQRAITEVEKHIDIYEEEQSETPRPELVELIEASKEITQVLRQIQYSARNEVECYKRRIEH